MQEKLSQIEQLSGNIPFANYLADSTYAEPVRKLQEEMYNQLLVLRENLA